MFKVIITMLTSVSVIDIKVKHIPVCGNTPVSAFKIEVNIVPAGLVILHREAAIPVSAVVNKRSRGIGSCNGFY